MMKKRVICIAVVLIIIALCLWKFCFQKDIPIEQKIYECAVQQVEQDLSIYSGTISCDEYSWDALSWVSEDTCNVEVVVRVKNIHGIEMEYVYEVQINVKNGVCIPVYCMRKV